MNAIAPNPVIESVEDVIGWHPNLERLRSEVQLARTGQPVSPWSIVEAECWIDLIEAELSAKSTQTNPHVRTQLIAWRTEIGRLRTLLKTLASSARPVSDQPSEEGGSHQDPSALRSQHHGMRATAHHHQPVYGGRSDEIPSAA
jgi:hypothetical protein